MVNGWDIAKKTEELQKELRKQEGKDNATATTSGNTVNIKKYKGYDAVINTTNGKFTSFEKSNMNVGGDTGTITLIATDSATESRATMIKVSADLGEIPTQEEWLTEYRTTNESEFNEMFAKSYSGPTATWANVSQNGTKTADELYAAGPAPYFNNIYDFIIKQGFATESYNRTYGVTFTCNNETITGTSAEFVVTKNGSYTISATKGEEFGTTTIEVDKCKIEEYSDIQSTNHTLNKDGYEVVIPAGFAYGISANVGTVTTGLVITDSIETVNGKNYSNGNEFVWIPIDKTNLTVGKTNKKMAQLKDGSSTNYTGVAYAWNTDSTGNTTYSGTIDPEIARDYDGGSYDTVGITTTSMQNEYNTMIASIQEYGGFYVARFEMGKDAFSKIGITPTSAAESSTSTWYGLYSKAKLYTNSKNSVSSQMIWGSQYDAMLNFGLTNSEDSGKVTETTNGNHTGFALKTGTYQGNDKINNIFDLEGNVSEWTNDPCGYSMRYFRGSDYTESRNSPCSRTGTAPYYSVSTLSSRLTLYINLHS